MKALGSVATREITYNEKVTKKELKKEEPMWRDPRWVSVFDARFPNKHIYRITACDTVFGREKWDHLIVRPMPVVKETPSYVNMAKIKDAFFTEYQYAMQVIPRREDYVSREAYTLHLWNYKGMISEADFHAVYKYLNSEEEKIEYLADGTGILRIFLPGCLRMYCMAIVCKEWPSWSRLVELKESVMGCINDAIIINRSFRNDVEAFENKETKVVIIWDAMFEELPSKILV